MTDPFSHLADALRTRRAVIADRALYKRDPAGHLKALIDVSREIDQAAAALPEPIDSQLAHFLQRASYDKALSHLESK